MVFRTFALLLIILAASISTTGNLPSLMYYCAGGDDEYISRPAFLFEPELANTPQLSPLYLTWNRYFNNSWEVDSVVTGDNIREWNNYFGGGLPAADINYVIYQAMPVHLLDIKVKWKFIGQKLDASIEKNKLVQLLVEKPDEEFLQYIMFAKSCEPFVTSSDYWEPENSHKGQEDTLRILAGEAERYYKSCPSPFLKLRYAYQVIRLLRYAQDWKSSADRFDGLVMPSKVQSVIRYWALEQKAGALYKLNRRGEGAYWFSKVFTECPSRRSVAYSSFSITSDSVWNDCIDQCKTPKEKTVLYFLRGINPRNSVLEEMKNIYAIDPCSEYLPVLLTREINRLESEDNSSHSDEPFWAGRRRRHDTTAVHDLRQFLDMCMNQKKVVPIDMWQLASSYLKFLDRDEPGARLTLAALKTSVRFDKVRDVIPRFETFYDVAYLQGLNDTKEDILFNRVLSTNHDKLRAYTILKYKQLYKERNDTIKEFLCSSGLSELKNRLDLALTQKIIDWSNKQYPTSFDKYLLDNRLKDEGYFRYRYYSDIEGANGKNGLLEVKGTILLGQHKLKDALEIYKLIPEDEQWRSSADPFTSRISDCRDCDFRDRSQKKYTHKALVQAILDYEQKLKTDPGHAMEYHRLLGNVYYNLTHFGNATEGLRFYHDCDRSFNWDAEKYKKTGIINFDVDCSSAKEHYLQAMSLAEAAGNIEVAAECCFMAAKCEQNEYYVTVVNDDEKYTTKNKLYKNYFKLMKERFSQTQFYTRAIKECMYFNNFASR